jgi:hypothetical protein
MGEISSTKGNNDMYQPTGLQLCNLQAKSPHRTNRRIYSLVDYTILSKFRMVRRLLIFGLRLELA